MKEYCTSIEVVPRVRLDLFKDYTFRVRKSDLPGEPFPVEYQIPFAIGHTEDWAPVAYDATRADGVLKVGTGVIEICVTGNGEWSVFTAEDDKRQIYPSDGPIHGMFRDGYIMFDSASAHRQIARPSGHDRYAHIR